VGQRVDAGTPLATIIDLSEVLVQARVPAQRLDSLLRAGRRAGPPGAAANVRAAAFPGQSFPATVFRFGLQTEGQTGDVPVWVRVPNSERLLRAGMNVQVELFGEALTDLALPETAMTVNAEGRRVVTVVRGGKAYPTEIEISGPTAQEVRAGGWVRVLAGLQAGDEVAVENGYGLPEDFPVTIMP